MSDKEDKDKKKKEKTSSKNPEKYFELEPTLDELFEEEFLNEVLSISQRRKRGRSVKRRSGRIARKRKITMRRRASSEKLKGRAKKRARDILKSKLAGNKKYASLAPSQKVQIDKRFSKISKSRVDQIAKRELPKVRRSEMERVKKMRTRKEDLSLSFKDYIEESKKLEESRKNWAIVANGKANIPIKKGKVLAIFDNKGLAQAHHHVENGWATIEPYNGADKGDMYEACLNDMKPKKRFHRLIDKDGKPVIDKRFKMFKTAKCPETYKEELEEFSQIMENYDPSDREEGTDSLVRIYRKDTPGQPTYRDDHIHGSYITVKKGDKVAFRNHSMDVLDDEPTDRRGIIVGSTVSHLRVRTPDGKLYKVRHNDVELVD